MKFDTKFTVIFTLLLSFIYQNKFRRCCNRTKMASTVRTEEVTNLQARDGAFYLHGKKIRILSGAMHYFRIVPEYWEDRLMRLKACGLNCVETYVPWNLHEEVRGEFNFNGILDLRRFIQLAHDLKLYVILRPGPYICSEWDFGGLPSWLLHDPEMKVRTSYAPYLEAVDKFFAKLLPLVDDLQISKGGPIIAMQIENEYGSFGDDLNYMSFLRDTMKKYGVKELLFTSDNGAGVQGKKLPDILMTANFQEKEHGYLISEYMNNIKQPQAPLMVMEFWTGWFDHWTEDHHVVSDQQFEETLAWILDRGGSVNFYMFHGGTNFGFMAGANEGLGATNEGGSGEPYSPDVTSYDYNAPVAENGNLTEKYFIIKRLLAEKCPEDLPSDLPPLPEKAVEAASYGEIACQGYMGLEEMLRYIEPVTLTEPLPMERLYVNNGSGQGFGFILYRKHVGNVSSVTFPSRIRDRATVILNGNEVETLDWLKSSHPVKLSTNQGTNVLDILVENCGRVNYADFRSPMFNEQRKGLSEIHVDGKKSTQWTVYPLEFKPDFISKLEISADWIPEMIKGRPCACRFTFTVADNPKDSFINTQGWTKGVVFVNGFNLGRYWNVGPQKTLYLPGPLLKKGVNQIIVFEIHSASDRLVFAVEPDLGKEILHKTVLPAWAKSLILLLKTTLRMGNWVWGALRPFIK